VSFLLDTNICSAHLRRPAGLSHYFVQHGGRLFIPTIVLAELYAWAYRRGDPAPVLHAIGEMLRWEVAVMDFDRVCALEFGKMRGQLAAKGITVPPVDLLIASVAIVHDFTLVTDNTKDFRAVPGLRLANWLKS